MAEDVSAQIRLGGTVTAVSALVAMTANLMVIAGSIIGVGLNSLQAGTDQIQAQRFEPYNQKPVPGTSVISALQLFQGEDITIVIRTKLNQEEGDNGYTYGAVLESSTTVEDTVGTATVTRCSVGTEGNASFKMNAGDSFWTGTLKTSAGGLPELLRDIKPVTMSGDAQEVLTSAMFTAELIKSKSGKLIGMIFTQR